MKARARRRLHQQVRFYRCRSCNKLSLSIMSTAGPEPTVHCGACGWSGAFSDTRGPAELPTVSLPRQRYGD